MLDNYDALINNNVKIDKFLFLNTLSVSTGVLKDDFGYPIYNTYFRTYIALYLHKANTNVCHTM